MTPETKRWQRSKQGSKKGSTPFLSSVRNNRDCQVKVKFFMRRPNNHFKNKNRLNQLKMAMPFARVGAPDIDNLAKFVLAGWQKQEEEAKRRAKRVAFLKAAAKREENQGQQTN